MITFIIIIYLIGMWVAYHLHQMADGSHSLFVSIVWPIVLLLLIFVILRDKVIVKMENWSQRK